MVGTPVHIEKFMLLVLKTKNRPRLLCPASALHCEEASVVVHAKTWGRRRLQNKVYASHNVLSRHSNSGITCRINQVILSGKFLSIMLHIELLFGPLVDQKHGAHHWDHFHHLRSKASVQTHETLLIHEFLELLKR